MGWEERDGMKTKKARLEEGRGEEKVGIGGKVGMEGKLNISREGCNGSRSEKRRGEMRVGGTLNGRTGLEFTDHVVPVPPPPGTWFGSELW